MEINNGMAFYKIAIVASCHIPPSKEWIKSLQSISSGKNNVKVIIAYDEWRHTELEETELEFPAEWDVYGYERQKEEMGEDMYAAFQKFHKSSAIKNFGHWLAWRDRFDIVMGIDSDCIVPPNFIGEHLEALMKKSHGWTNPISRTGWFPRGYPYAQRELRTALSLGLWNNELDLYGKDRVDNPSLQTKDPMVSEPHVVSDGFIPLSGMNWACWADVIPGLLFLPNFEIQNGEKTEKMRRHDDIWGGYIFQKIMCIRNERIVYGNPIVFHDSAIDAARDAEEEEGMIAWEYLFYGAVDQLFSDPIEWGMYEDIMDTVVERANKLWKDTEWQPVADALQFWNTLFGQTEKGEIEGS